MKSLNHKKLDDLAPQRCTRPFVVAADSLIVRNAQRPPTCFVGGRYFGDWVWLVRQLRLQAASVCAGPERQGPRGLSQRGRGRRAMEQFPVITPSKTLAALRSPPP